MKPQSRTATVAATLSFLGAFACADSPRRSDSSAVRIVVDRANASLDSAFRRGDAAAAASLMTDDVVLSLLGVPDWQGRETVRGHLAEVFEANTVAAHTFAPTEVAVYGDVVFERGDLTWVAGPKGKPAPPATHARYSLIRVRGSDSSWRIHRYIENPSVPATR